MSTIPPTGAAPREPLRLGADRFRASIASRLAAGCRLVRSPRTLLALAAFAASAVRADQNVLVTGNPLGNEAAVQPASSLGGDALTLRRAGTLGETLDGLPGVASTWFGPNASRPVVRGLDGNRVRLLDNGGANVDVSGLSFDHAAAIDPLAVERIEVLRGPAALLYGGNATGGVVNTIDNRIPRVVPAGFGGRAELRAGGAADERAGSALLEGGSGEASGGLAWHVDAFDRSSDDLRVPRHVPQVEGETLPATTRVRNSAADSHGGAAGAGWVADDGFLGASLDTFRDRYGTTAEPDVHIRMKRDRVALAGERRALAGPFGRLAFHAGHTDYRHDEIEGDGSVGTRFESRGDELRLEAQQRRTGRLDGVVGLQAEQVEFSALGAEAYLPQSKTRSLSVFALEQWHFDAFAVAAGMRVERVQIRSAGDAADADPPRFGPRRERRFTPLSASIGVHGGLPANWHWSGSVGHTERAPSDAELYANGAHLATAAFERGDASLGVERSEHFELGLGRGRGTDRIELRIYHTRFGSYVALDTDGTTVDVPGADGDPARVLPLYVYRAVPARFTGVELEAHRRIAERPWVLDLSATIDAVRGDNRASGEPLPRIAPLRGRVEAEAARGPWRLGLRLRATDRQSRVPSTDRPTAGYAMIDLWLTRRVDWGPTETLLFARLDNVTDQLGYSASTISTLRSLVPLPGRALTAGLRVAF